MRPLIFRAQTRIHYLPIFYQTSGTTCGTNSPPLREEIGDEIPVDPGDFGRVRAWNAWPRSSSDLLRIGLLPIWGSLIRIPLAILVEEYLNSGRIKGLDLSASGGSISNIRNGAKTAF